MGIDEATANPAALAPCFEVFSFGAARGGEREAAAQPVLAPQSPRRAGEKPSAARGGCPAPSLLPALAQPGATPALPGRRHEQGRLARPARWASDKGRKEAGTNRGEEATAARLPPGERGRRIHVRSAGANSGGGRSDPEGTERGRRARGKRGGRSGSGRRREERGRWLTRIRLKRLLSLGGSGTDGMARAALGQARLAGVGAAREGRLSVRGTGGGGNAGEEKPKLGGAAAAAL